MHIRWESCDGDHRSNAGCRSKPFECEYRNQHHLKHMLLPQEIHWFKKHWTKIWEIDLLPSSTQIFIYGNSRFPLRVRRAVIGATRYHFTATQNIPTGKLKIKWTTESLHKGMPSKWLLFLLLKHLIFTHFPCCRLLATALACMANRDDRMNADWEWEETTRRASRSRHKMHIKINRLQNGI